ncbi:MAG: tail-specific protease, partial [Chitinophagaceae bacterium]|nr:tail-specific protease [Chitinophagaceae bacterium]
MKRLPILVLVLVAGMFLAFKSIKAGAKTPVNPPSKYEQIMKLVGEMLSQGHYSPQDINDAFSKKVFAKYLKELDIEKNFFLKSDLDALKKFETRVDDEIKGAPVEFFLAAGKTFTSRMEQASAVVNELLAKPFDFTADEEVLLDADKLEYPVNEKDIKERWRKKLKYMTLERYADLLDTRDKNK